MASGSPGAAYLARRGIPPALARAHGIGWGGDTGAMRGRVVFPLTDRTGVVTSATGRAVVDGAEAKYWTLPTPAHPKGWFNGGAVAAPEGRPLYLCEGPFDALALLAGGIHTAAAVLGVTGVRADWLAGVRRVGVCFDADATGQAARAELAFAAEAVEAAVEPLPAAALAGCKDIGEHWERHGTLPAGLAAHWEETQLAAAPPEPEPGPAPWDALDEPPIINMPDSGPVDNWPAADALLNERARAACPPDRAGEAAEVAAVAGAQSPIGFAYWDEDVRNAMPAGDPDAAPGWPSASTLPRAGDSRRPASNAAPPVRPSCWLPIVPAGPAAAGIARPRRRAPRWPCFSTRWNAGSVLRRMSRTARSAPKGACP